MKKDPGGRKRKKGDIAELFRKLSSNMDALDKLTKKDRDSIVYSLRKDRDKRTNM